MALCAAGQFRRSAVLFSQLLEAFLRNNGNPGLAFRAVLCGGIFNVFGDYFFVFVLDWASWAQVWRRALAVC